MADSPFESPAIRARVLADVSRIQSEVLTWSDDPTGDLDTKTIEILVETLDAHARIYLEAVTDSSLVSEYVDTLRRTGTALMQNAENRGILQDPYREERLRKIAESSIDYIERKRSLTPQQQEKALGNAVEGLRIELMEKALKWHEWRDQLLVRIETRFEARYRHWLADALDQVGKLTPKPPQGSLAIAANWEDVEISFLSDERVQILSGGQHQTFNYGELGFADRRNGKPNQAWVLLRHLAESDGTVRDATWARGDWSKVEKRIQEIRKHLRAHFRIDSDPLPFVEGTGYRARMKIRCAPSFEK